MSRKLDPPFADIIAAEQNTAPAIKPPAYATQRGFHFNLDVLAKGLTLTPSQAFNYVKFSEGSTLDEAQQSAVVQALSTGLALIQGPPGTGKSYTGVAIIKALLHNRSKAKIGPIICVCYTNHALDQLLEHLIRDGVEQVIRLGSRSKSTLLENLTLRNVAKEAEVTKAEKHDTWQHNRDIGECVEGLEDVLLGLNNPGSLANIRDYLEKTNKRQYNELFGRGVDEDGFQEVKGKKFRAIESWLRNAPRKLTSNRPIRQLKNISLKEMSAPERMTLYKHWIEQKATELSNDLGGSLGSYHESKDELDKCHQERDLRCLREAQIIGVTTSGLARNVEVLQRVHAKVMLCEEAGEVLEAHTLTAFLPSVEHAILIGDHEQLRPQINNYELQHDNPRGKRFALDISLFERLVKPPMGNIQVPLSSLKTQRRMHPSISELVRVPLYPDLQDHPSVSEYPEVEGMRDRLYWLDHQAKEDAQNPQIVSSSKTNSFEVEMVAALVSHLVKQGTYGHEDIAVLTPYLGQLQKLRRRLANDFAIVVGERDEDDLVAKGIDDDNGTGVTTDLRVPVQKMTLLNALRIATVDNFQGEEAKVIVVSLVRSNDEHNCGFLKTSNRINVLLSRARHGMYIIGNSATSKHVPMWAQVLSIMESSNNIGPSLALCCPRHKDTSMNVSVPDDFSIHAPEGGCVKKCTSRLPCGHSCINMCHSTALHNAVRCLEDCPRTKTGCEHACPKRCGDKCDSLCQVQMSNIELPCGHIAAKLKCWEVQATDKVSCRVKIDQTMTGCNHTIKVLCHEVPLGIEYPCSAICGAILPCGHNCMEKCKECITKAEGSIVSTAHGKCKTRCGRPYTTCTHSCQVPCHGNEPCELCNNICSVTCSHSKCMKKCHEACSPCAEFCSWSCPHRGQCSLPCAVPCDLLPCSERCPEMLGCGHRCPSICGEICPPVHYCQTCGTENVKGMVVDYIMMSTYGEVDLDEEPCIIPSCGHILTLESMDGHMSMSDLYTMTDGTIVGLKDDAKPFSASEMKVCPTCRGSLQNLNRYSRIVRRALIDEATKKFIVWANKGFVPLVSSMEMVERALRDRVGANQVAVSLPREQSEPIRVTGTRDQQFNLVVKMVSRDKVYSALFKLRTAIKYFLQQVDEKEQPFGRIYDLVQHARRSRGIEVNMNTPVDILQVRNRLLTTVLMIRCDYSLLLTFLEDQKGNAGNSSSIQVDLNISRQECEGLISESLSRNQPGSAVEGHLYWARYLALERSFKEPSDQLDQLVDAAKEHLQSAYQICDQFPGQTAGMKEEVEEVEKMLRGSTFYLPVSNEEKAAVYAAMASDFRGTGHWYYCENGHPFTVGECGMPMETSTCPQCGSKVGGADHTAVAGVTPATDLEAQFRGLAV